MSANRHTRYQAVVLREDDALLLVRCVFLDGRDWWMLPGGGREDETEEACIVREVREETGLDVRVESLLRDAPADPPDGMYARHRTYLCRVRSGEAAPGGGEGADATLVEVMWLPLFDEGAWPAAIRNDRFLSPQLRAFRAALIRPFAGALFDFDDTLLDRRATISHYLDRHAARVGFSPETSAAYRSRLWQIEGAGYVPRATVFEQLCAEFPEAGIAGELATDWESHAFDTCVYLDGATDILAWCREAGFRTGIVTNGRSFLQRPKLERAGVIPLVDEVLISGEVGLAKPDAELFRRAAERLGLPPRNCVFVGDHPSNDVMGAEAAGMTAIWIERDIAWPREWPRPKHSVREIGALRHLLRPLSTNRV